MRNQLFVLLLLAVGCSPNNGESPSSAADAQSKTMMGSGDLGQCFDGAEPGDICAEQACPDDKVAVYRCDVDLRCKSEVGC